MPLKDSTTVRGRLVLRDRTVRGVMRIENGLVASVEEEASERAGSELTTSERSGADRAADETYVLPGFIELHTDHIETHYKPRPGVVWDPVLAAQAHDAQIAASGITTVFDALCVGFDDARMAAHELRALVDGVRDAEARGLLRAQHFTHLRCEVSSPDVVAAYETFDAEPSVRLVSLMDHTPGQRQFREIAQHRLYFQKREGLTDAAYERLVEDLTARARRWSAPNRRAIAARARDRGAVIASHDDATVAHVEEARRDGVRVAEFPTTIEAAEASRAAGMAVLMGAPNVVRGGSHSGNVSALDLAARGALDILSSDYVPASLMQAVFALSRGAGFDLASAVRTVSTAPARAMGLDDRGALEPGLRADFSRVTLDEGADGIVRPTVREVYAGGRRVV